MLRRLTLALFGVSLIVLLAPARAQNTSAILPGEFMGMVARDPHYEWNTNPAYPNDSNRAFYDAMGRHLAAAGVKWVRIEFFAEEHSAGFPDLRGQVNVEMYRYFINTVAPRHGFKVLGLLATPLVRRPPTDWRLGSFYVGQYIDPERLEDPLDDTSCPVYGYANPYMCIWLNNAFAVARAFPYDKTTGAGVAAYEVLNEENRYINGGGKGLAPQRVADLTATFYRVFKQNGGPDGSLGSWRHDVQIILGGMQPNRCGDCFTSAGTPMTDREYLDAVYKSPAFQTFRAHNPSVGYPVDGIGYHPYPMEMRYGLVPELTGISELYRVPERMQAMRNVMLQNGDAKNKIWVTEVGDRGNPHDLDNQRRQAEFLQTMYRLLWQQREFVHTVFWFKYEDFAVTTGNENWGVVRLYSRTPTSGCPSCEYAPDGSVEVFKLSYRTYQNMALYGSGLQTYRAYLPVFPHRRTVAAE